MKLMPLQVAVMAGKLGDIFWDLPPYIVYAPGFDIGCNIYVANPTGEEKEYALMARLTSESTLISEEALPVYGLTWFSVEPGDFETLKGALRFSQSSAVLTVSLIEKETGDAVDAVATALIAPATNVLPPTWPGTTTPSNPGTQTQDSWSVMLNSFMPVLMLGMFGIMLVKSGREKSDAR